jgi:2-polyprenyl-3-methyl-5-hydroxy-6-metoxy-1,4-benzoquinol methylase
MVKMKYDFEIDYNEHNVWSVAASRIKPNSIVLEFGSATGYFTKYLKEILKCRVFIVEIDKNSFDCAMKYAADGICENIECYGWADKFYGIKFDFIIFLDVLEHLYNPGAVLDKCKEYMSEEASIILSIPNIAHNSILINLFSDNFIYTEMGLLDNTHIRFFAYHQLIALLEKYGLYPAQMNAIYKKVGTNEIDNSYESMPANCRRELKQRKNGDLYQFLFECKIGVMNENNTINNLQSPKNYNAKFYIREKTYFLDINGTEDVIQMEFKDSESNEITLELCDVPNSIIQIEYIRVNGKEISQYSTNAFYSDDNVYYFNSNAKILHKNQLIVRSIYICLRYISLDCDNTSFVKISSRIHKYEEENDALTNKITQHSEAIAQKNQELKNEKNIIIQKDILLKNKEENIIQKENELHNKEMIISQNISEISELKHENILLTQHLYDIYSTRTFKLLTKIKKLNRLLFHKMK